MTTRLEWVLVFAVGAAALGCDGSSKCEKLNYQDLQRVLIDLRTKNVIMIGDSEGQMKCIKDAVAPLLELDKAPAAMEGEIVRIVVREKWSDLEPLVAARLASKDEATATATMEAIAAEAPERIKPRLGEFLASDSDKMSAAAARWIGLLEASEHTNGVIERYAQLKGKPTERDFANVLIDLKAGEQLADYILAAKDDHGYMIETVREASVNRLPMVKLLAHPTKSVRTAAIRSLGRSQEEGDCPLVLKALGQATKDRESDVAELAAKHVGVYARGMGGSRQDCATALFDEALADPKSALAPHLCAGLQIRSENKDRFGRAARGRNKTLRACAKKALSELK